MGKSLRFGFTYCWKEMDSHQLTNKLLSLLHFKAVIIGCLRTLLLCITNDTQTNDTNDTQTPEIGGKKTRLRDLWSKSF